MSTADDVRFYLQRVISFHRPLANVAGGATGGLFLSQLLYWSDKGADPDGWIYKTQEEWQEETALTRSEQERARRILRDKGILEEVKRGVPSRLFYRLNMDALATMLDSASLDASSRKRQASKQDPTGKDVESCTPSPITETTTKTTQKMVNSEDPQEEISDKEFIRRVGLRYRLRGTLAIGLANKCRDGEGQLQRAAFEALAYQYRDGKRS